MTQKYFTHLKNFPALSDFYIKEALEKKYEFITEPSTLYCANTSFNESSIFKEIQKHFRCGTRYFANPAYSLYDWHTDNKRSCTINWLIKTNEKSSCFYRDPIVTSEKPSIFYNLIEVNYKLYNPVLLNTTLDHCVINNYNDTRIILSVSLFDTSYEKALKILENIKNV
jgi:hypothetical protein